MNVPSATEWYSIPEIADFLGVRQRDVRTMISERKLFAIRRGENNALAISGDQIVVGDGGAHALSSIKGTITALQDAGYSDAEVAEWMHRENDELGSTPMQCLRDGQTHAVRRAIAGLAF